YERVLLDDVHGALSNVALGFLQVLLQLLTVHGHEHTTPQFPAHQFMCIAMLVSLAIADHRLLSGNERSSANALLQLRSACPGACADLLARMIAGIPHRGISGRPQRLLRTSLGLDGSRRAFSSSLCLSCVLVTIAPGAHA